MADLFPPQTHKEQLSRVEALEMKTRQADEVGHSVTSEQMSSLIPCLADIQY